MGFHWGFFLPVLIGVSRLPISLPSSLGYRRQRKPRDLATTLIDWILRSLDSLLFSSFWHVLMFILYVTSRVLVVLRGRNRENCVFLESDSCHLTYFFLKLSIVICLIMQEENL